jgi:hypothetical protein
MTASNVRKPRVDLVDCTSHPQEAILAAWFNSRDEGPTWTVKNIWDRLHGRTQLADTDATIFQRLMKDKATGDIVANASNLFYDIVSMDIPVLEFVTFQLSFDAVARSFVDQLDRTRTAAFWEQSVRVLDLSQIADRRQYFIPAEVENDQHLQTEYEDAMHDIQESYKRLKHLGLRPELARGIIPMHVAVRADASISLRTLLQIIRKRACFFAQGAYWEPVISQIIDIVVEKLPDPDRTRKLFARLPCDLEVNSYRCPYKRDIMDRLVDRSNPICPILYVKELDEDERDRTLAGMDDMYGLPQFKKVGDEYLAALRPVHITIFGQDLETRSKSLGLSLRK